MCGHDSLCDVLREGVYIGGEGTLRLPQWFSSRSSEGKLHTRGSFSVVAESEGILSLIQAQAQLDEDGLILWQAALRNTSTLDGVNGGPGLFELAQLAIHLLANNFDLLGKIVSIVESYILLDASRFLQVSSRARRRRVSRLKIGNSFLL